MNTDAKLAIALDPSGRVQLAVDLQGTVTEREFETSNSAAQSAAELVKSLILEAGRRMHTGQAEHVLCRVQVQDRELSLEELSALLSKPRRQV